tara:strand:+ start:9076 stop:9804 length:729 start_codon:yes stop_codon:yes gene_type:complete
MSSTFRELARSYAFGTTPVVCENSVIILCRGASAQDGIALAEKHPETDLIVVNDWEGQFPTSIIERGKRSGKTTNFLTSLGDRQFRFGERTPYPTNKPIRRYNIKDIRANHAYYNIDKSILPDQNKSFDYLWNENPDTGLRAICYASFFYDNVIVAGLDFWEADYYMLPVDHSKDNTRERVDFRKNTAKKIKKGNHQRPDFIDALCEWMGVTKDTNYFYYTFSESFRTESYNITNCSVSNIR